MTKTEQRAKNALYIFWQNSGVDQPFENLEKIILSPRPRFYSQFGSSIEYSNLSDTEVQRLMKKLAEKNRGVWPDAHESGIFFDALLDEMGSFSNKVGIVTQAVKDTASDVVSVAKFGLSAYAIVGAVAFFFVIMSYGKSK